ncbi:hypothetical protein [Acaryochloris sp. 'Moss Beach']|nr:hypothetical protein [Acaryochloris sp. 'Moss Beach']
MTSKADRGVSKPIRDGASVMAVPQNRYAWSISLMVLTPPFNLP